MRPRNQRYNRVIRDAQPLRSMDRQIRTNDAAQL